MRQQALYATLTLMLLTTTLFANHVDEYIQNYKDIAQREMLRSDIPASIILAQGIHESAWGKGELAVESRNHFGIKCKDYWQGPTYYIEDDDYENGRLIKSCFRSYENVEYSYIDHTNFLLESDRYQSLFNYDKTDYKNWAKGLKKCGYATDPNYAEKLIRIIETHQLYIFDAVLKPAMEAPKFYIPTQFLNLHENIDPVVYTYEEKTNENDYLIVENNSVEQFSKFDYEIPVEVPVQQSLNEIESEAPYDPETTRPSSITVRPREQMNGVITNNTSGDKRMLNLTRKPRSSSGAGPR